MQKWEYMFLDGELEQGYFSKPRQLLRYINNQEVPNWKKEAKSLEGYANELGKQGWELVSVPNLLHMAFKRPIEE